MRFPVYCELSENSRAKGVYRPVYLELSVSQACSESRMGAELCPEKQSEFGDGACCGVRGGSVGEFGDTSGTSILVCSC